MSSFQVDGEFDGQAEVTRLDIGERLRLGSFLLELQSRVRSSPRSFGGSHCMTENQSATHSLSRSSPAAVGPALALHPSHTTALQLPNPSSS